LSIGGVHVLDEYSVNRRFGSGQGWASLVLALMLALMAQTAPQSALAEDAPAPQTATPLALAPAAHPVVRGVAMERYSTVVHHNGHIVLWHGAWRDKLRGGGSRVADPPVAAAKSHGFSILADSGDATSARAAAEVAHMLGDGETRVVTVLGKASGPALSGAVHADSADLALAPTDGLVDPQTGTPPDLRAKAPLVARLFGEDIEVVVPQAVADIHQLAGKKVNVDAAGGATATTAKLVFSRLKISATFTNFPLQEALARLARGEIDAVFVLGGRDAKGLADFGKDGRFRLASIPFEPSLQALYYPASIKAADRPNLIRGADAVDTLSVSVALLAIDATAGSKRSTDSAPLVDRLFDQFERLAGPQQETGWGEVNLGAKLDQWPRFKGAQDWLDRNAVGGDAALDDFRKIANVAKGADAGPSDADSQKLYVDFLRWSGVNQP